MFQDMGIKPIIPLRIHSTAKGKGTGDVWGKAVQERLGGSQEARVDRISEKERAENKRYWKSTVGYDQRWLVEMVPSAFKKLFGDCLHSRKWENMIQEIKLRIALYNQWQDKAVT